MGLDYSAVVDLWKEEGLDKLKVPKELKEIEDFRAEILKDKETEKRGLSTFKKKKAFEETHMTSVEIQNRINEVEEKILAQLGISADTIGAEAMTDDKKREIESIMSTEMQRENPQVRDAFARRKRAALGSQGLDPTGTPLPTFQEPTQPSASDFTEPVKHQNGNTYVQNKKSGAWFLVGEESGR